MRIESLSRYRYFLQILREEPIHLRPYAYLLILIPLLVICFMFDWDGELLLFLALGYACASIGFYTAVQFRKTHAASLKSRVHERLVLDYIDDVVVLQDNQSQKIAFVNTAFYSLLGYKKTKVFNIRFESFIETNFVRLFKKSKSSKLSIRPLDAEDNLIQMRKQDGSKIWMELHKKTVVEHGAYTLYTFRDVSENIARNKATKQFARDLMERKMNKEKVLNLNVLKVG